MRLDFFNNKRYSSISVIFSALGIISTIKINYDIALRYLSSDGKTQALFGITEILYFYYQYFIVVLSLTAIIFAVIGTKKNENRLTNRVAYLLGVMSIILIFTRIWRLMI